MDILRSAAGDDGSIASAGTSWILLVSGALVVVLLSTVYDSMTKKYQNLPPGPRNWPVIGAMLAMESTIQKSFTKLAKQHGPIVYLRVGVQQMIVVSSAEVAEELLKQKDGQFADRFVQISKTASKYCGFDGGLFGWTDNDAEHILRRKLVFTEFFTPAKLKTYEELRRQEMAVMVEKIFNTMDSAVKSRGGNDNRHALPTDEVTIGIRDTVLAMIRNVIFALVIGERFDRLSPTNYLQEFPQVVDEFLRLALVMNVPDLLPFLRRIYPQGLINEYKAFGKRQGELYEKLTTDRRRIMKLQREGKPLTDSDVTERNFVDFLLKVQEEGAKLSDNIVHGTVAGILSAGIDTTASQTEWIMLELARHPEILQRLQAEVDGVVGMDRPVTDADVQVPNMPFLNAVVMETLRLHPILPVSFPHSNKEAATLAGYTVPANTAVFVNIVNIVRDPKAWKDPLQFNPDRFMGTEGKIKANGTNYNILTFSGGRRGCVGYNLGYLLLMRATATLVHAFDWFPPPGLSSKDVSTEERGNLFLRPIRDLLLTPKPRVLSSLYQSKVAT